MGIEHCTQNPIVQPLNTILMSKIIIQHLIIYITYITKDRDALGDDPKNRVQVLVVYQYSWAKGLSEIDQKSRNLKEKSLLEKIISSILCLTCHNLSFELRSNRFLRGGIWVDQICSPGE